MKTKFMQFNRIKELITLIIIITLVTSCSKDEDLITITATSYTTSIEENVATDTSLGSISAVSNNNGTLTYNIASQSVINAVKINSSTGELTVNVASAFDFETNSEISGVVNIDTNGASKSINFTITLIDVVAKKVLILGAESNLVWLEDVQEKVESTNLFDTVDIHNASASVLSVAQLMEYDAVLVYTNNSPMNPSQIGDNLAAFIDNGGGVVEATFAGNVQITGNYNDYKVYDTSNTIGQLSGSTRTLGDILDSNHVILENVVDFNGGTSSYYNTNIASITGGSTIAEYDNGEPLIIVKNNIGQKNVSGVFLNFYPPSGDGRNDFWDQTTDGHLILGNSLKWVGNK